MNKPKNKNAIITMIAETHIHVGVGQSTGALDLPVARERTTHYPFIPGSGVKGAFRVWAEELAKLSKDNIDKLFGKEGQVSEDAGDSGGAGNLLCSDGRLLLLPVRCLSDAYKWVTCPEILQRFARDCRRAGQPSGIAESISVPKGKYLSANTQDNALGLEEREFTKAESQIDGAIISALKNISGIAECDLKNRLVILSDKDFTWFARYALPVMARNVLDENKISTNLWYEESLAPDTVIYILLGERKTAVKTIIDAISNAKYIQIGGNETIGQGWFKMGDYLEAKS